MGCTASTYTDSVGLVNITADVTKNQNEYQDVGGLDNCYQGEICHSCYENGIYYVDYENRIPVLNFCQCCNKMLCNHHFYIHNGRPNQSLESPF